MNIAILGAKTIGGTLGRKWVGAGHTVIFGVRHVTHPDTRALVVSLGEQASATTTAGAIAAGEVVVFAIPGHVMDQTIADHAAALNGKIVVDATNKMGQPVMNSAAAFAHFAPGARVYRAFNSLGWEDFENPRFGDEIADLFYCGPEGPAQAVVEQLIADVGLRPVRVGGLEQIQLVDLVANLWFALALGQKRGRHLAFKLLSR
jgi:8-hydroxy-5-deazaflavin:NADPH oxidoreductase